MDTKNRVKQTFKVIDTNFGTVLVLKIKKLEVMVRINHIYSMAIIIMMAFASCSNQRYVSSETDDIYFSSADRETENAQEYNMVTEVKGEDYRDSSEPQSGYYSLGKESYDRDQNQRSEQAYANGMNQPENVGSENQSASTINNFYGNTTYSEGDYYDDSYATRLRRFNNINAAIGFYDPFFVDPYWSMGWGWNSWNKPVNGWSVGWNSWGGWNVGYNVGWGYPAWGFNNYYAWNRWNDPFFYNSPWNSFYGPFGWNNSWGWNNGWNNKLGWNNGYAWGYSDGFNDGFYGNGNVGRQQSRPVIRGKAPVAGNDGFSSQTVSSRNDAPGRSHERVNRMTQGKVADRAEPIANSRASEMASAGRLDRLNTIYQTNRANPRSEKAANNRYEVRDRSKAQDKYNVSSGSNNTVGNRNDRILATPKASVGRSSANDRYTSRNSNSYSGSNRATYGNERPRSNQGSQNKRPDVRNDVRTGSSSNSNARSNVNQTRPNTQRAKPRQYTPSNSKNGSNSQPRTNSQPRRNTSATPAQRTRTRTTAPRTAPSRTAPSRSNSVSPSRSPSRSYSAPRSSSPSRSMSSPSRSSSGSGMSAPSNRGGGRR